jgi:hypothetical protein
MYGRKVVLLQVLKYMPCSPELAAAMALNDAAEIGTQKIDLKDAIEVNALAMKIVFPFIAKDDIRMYLCGANIRPLDVGGVMIMATDGHRYVIVRDPNGMTEYEINVAVQKDGLKHANSKHTFDVLSNGHAMILDDVAAQLFVQPGRSLIEGAFPRIENVASVSGYKEGLSGAVNPTYLADALEISSQFGSIRFFTRDQDSPLMFVYGGLDGLECFGGIAKMRDAFDSLPLWFPRRVEPTTLEEV